MVDFTLKQYESLISSMGDYDIIPVKEYSIDKENYIILRHDIDEKPHNALLMATLESKYNMTSTYYFRSTPQSFDIDIIKKIDKMGHEVGYHYETLNQTNGDIKKAVKEFGTNLKMFRKIVPVDTVCMHGSPLGKYNNLDIWNEVTLKDFNLKCDPYLSIDFEKVQYFSDTGRTWKVTKSSVRDIVPNQKDYGVKTTQDLISFINSKKKDRIMILAHSQRWSCKNIDWCQELVGQNVKNVGKTFLRKRGK